MKMVQLECLLVCTYFLLIKRLVLKDGFFEETGSLLKTGFINCLGYLFCVECDVYFKAIQKNDKHYRPKVIEQHFERQSHQDFLKKEKEAYWAKFTCIEKERLSLIWMQSIAKYGIPYEVFEKDTLLKEAIGISIEAQIKQPVDRKSLNQLFPSPDKMALKLPIMKKKIDG